MKRFPALAGIVVLAATVGLPRMLWAVQPADFSISVEPDSVLVITGNPGEYVVTVSPVGGSFDQEVTLSCRGLTPSLGCDFEEGLVTPGGTPKTVALNITTPTFTTVIPSHRHSPPWPQGPAGAVLFALLWILAFGLLLVSRRLKKPLAVPLAGLVLALAASQVSCQSQIEFPDTVSTVDIDVVGTSGSIEHSFAIKLTVV